MTYSRIINELVRDIIDEVSDGWEGEGAPPGTAYVGEDACGIGVDCAGIQDGTAWPGEYAVGAKPKGGGDDVFNQ